MKHLLCYFACLTAAMAETPEQAAARIDYALMHDYEMVRPRFENDRVHVKTLTE